MVNLPLEKPARGSDHLFIEDYDVAEEPSNEVKLQATKILVRWLVEHWTKKQQNKRNPSTLPDRGVFYSPARHRKTVLKPEGSINS